MRRLFTRRKAARVIAAVFAFCVIGVCVFIAPNLLPNSGTPLPSSDSLADSDGGPVTLAASYEADSLQKFESVLHIEDAQGNHLSLDNIPANKYSGFLFKTKTSPGAADDISPKMVEAVDIGLVRPIAGNLYEVQSLDELAGLLDVNQLDYIEPNFNLQIVGQSEGASTSNGQLDVNVGSSAEKALSPMGGTAHNPTPDWPPNDQYYTAGKLWSLDMLNVDGAWQQGLDGDPYVYNSTPVRDTPVRVAIIDTGLYGTGVSESPHEDLDYDKVDIGYDWINGNNNSTPDAKGHGTFVAGLIGAKVNNDGVGVAGLMPNVTLVPEKVFDTGSASTANVISAIYHASGYYNGTGYYPDVVPADVINMSLGGEYNESSLEEACDYAVSQGILVVASAGNDGVSTPNYPAAYESVVGVASVNSSKQRSTWSQYGQSVFVTAPGESVSSTYNEGASSYATASGTSFSGPEVAALGAMCKSVYPDIDQDTFKSFLIETSTQMDGYDQGTWNQYFGYGLVDFNKMASTVLASQTLPWYNLSFAVTDENGVAIENAAVTVSAAEDISWLDDDSATPAIQAGSLAAGSVVEPENGIWKVHRGNYRYKVVAPGYYTETGTIKTYAENQQTPVRMKRAYEATVNVVDSTGSPVVNAELAVSSSKRTEDPTSHTGNAYTFDLAPGSYDFSATPVSSEYEPAAGSFVMEYADASFNAVLYRPSELATVSFEVRSAADDSLLTRNVGISVADSSGVIIAPQQDGSFRLAKGGSYRVTTTKVGYDTKTQEFTVGADVSEQSVSVSMTPAQNRIEFNLLDENGGAVSTATINMADGSGNVLDPRTSESGYVFYLPSGSYTYEIVAPGYASVQASLNVSTSANTITVHLKSVPQSVSFNVTDANGGASIQDASIKVSTTRDMRTIPGNNGVWQLSPGSYRYTVYKQGYDVAQGTFTVAGSTLAVDVALRQKQGGATRFAGGSGTEEDPYLIANEAQLRYLAQGTEIVRMNDSSAATNKHMLMDGYYKLIDDIELTDEWYPIGNEESSSNYFRFAGHFDGNGHTVSNVYINQPGLSYQGFFGSVAGATITNLTVTGPGVSGASYVGGLVGRVYYYKSSEFSSWNTPSTTISQCGNELSVTGRYAVGGIAGSAQGVDQDSDGKEYDPGSAGGITVTACYNTGDITASQNGEFTKSTSAAGGIVGSAQHVLVQDCYNKGTVQAGYYAGGIAGNSRRCTLYTSYDSGRVVQYVKSSGYENTAGAIAGNVYYTLASDCYFLERDDSTNKIWCGSPDTASTHGNCLAKTYADMYRTDSFVSLMNENTAINTVGTSFVLGRDYPLLSWQIAPDALLAPAPHIIVQPQGIEPRNAYKEGDVANALTAKVDPVSAGTITWAWYASDNLAGTGAVPVEGAIGTGVEALFVPSTAQAGTVYYFCEFTNSVSSESAYDEAVARTDAAAIYTRSLTNAQDPAITKLNPSQTADVNTEVVVKTGTNARLTVEAQVADGGELSYQWYSTLSDGSSATTIEDATSSSYYADTSMEGTFYYYVAITNTLGPGNESTVFSDRIAVHVIPYTIDSYEDLAALQTEVNGGINFAGITITLTEDIEIPDGVDWTPIGTPSTPFQGYFVGGSGYASSQPENVSTHKITNLNINGDAHGNEYLGLFGFTQDALIFDVQVQGSITGAANSNAGLLVGYASTFNTTNGYAYIENCTTLPGSSVEGKYRIGGLVGAGGSNFNNCSNHADVHARAFARETAPTTPGWWAVGGVTGFAGGSGELMGCYNTGAVTVDAVSGASDYCAEYVGGIVGYTGYISGVFSSFNAGAISTGTVTETPLLTHGKVRYAGSVAGYVTYANCANIHYLENTYTKGANDDSGAEFASCHSYAYFKTSYFLNQLATGYGRYTPSHFALSQKGVPHYVWEDENVTPGDDGTQCTSEPYMVDVQSADMPEITTKWSGRYFQGGVSRPIYLLAEPTDGGALEFYWQQRDPSNPAAGSWGFDDGWGEYHAATASTRVYSGKEYQAGSFTVPVDTVGSMQYRLVVRSAAESAQNEPGGIGKESATNPISITVLDSSQGIFLEDQSKENAEDNPWVIDTPVRMKFFCDLVNGVETLPGFDDNTFKGQYVKLGADINLSGYENWTPIGLYSSYHDKEFQGIFDGGGHKVTGLRIDRKGTAVLNGSPWNPEDFTATGLFGSTYLAAIRNVEIAGSVYLDNLQTSSTSTQAWMTGGIVGHAYGTHIENCVNRANVAGWQGVGGIVGIAEACVIVDCENLGTVKPNDTSAKARYGAFQIGGVVGYLNGLSAADAGAGVYNCFNSGMVTGHLWDGSYDSGAIVGEVKDARVQDTYYLAGSISCDNSTSAQMTGVGTRSTRPQADVAGTCLSIENANNPQTAWALNMSPTRVTENEVLSHSGRWGNYSRADLGDAAPKVHLLRGSEAKTLYRANTTSTAASVSATPEYVQAGDEVQVSWSNKPGFEVNSVSWLADGATGPGAVLGTGNAGGGSFTMPEGNVSFVVDAVQDSEHQYAVSVKALYKGNEAAGSVGSVQLSTDKALAGSQVDITLSVQEGYQVKSVTVKDSYGDDVLVTRADGLHYSLTMNAADAQVEVVFEDRGTPVAESERAQSLDVDRKGLHSAAESDRSYHEPNLLFDMLVFSGSYFGAENPLMTYELESVNGVSLFEQSYSIGGQDTSFTGVDLSLLIHSIGGSEAPAADAPVRIETGSGDVYECTYGDLTALTYNRYDSTGQPIERGLPVLLYFGVNDVPNTDGGMGVVFGESSPFKEVTTDGLTVQSMGESQGGAVVLHDVTRISVASAAGEPDINYSQHSYSMQGYPFNDLTWVDGGELNGDYGQSDLHIRIYNSSDGERKLVDEKVISVTDIEKMANEDASGVQRGNYSVMLYEEKNEATDGIYNDYYEGYDLYKILQWAGVPYDPKARVQFYQSGMRGLANSWETVNVSLGYLAGNGARGEGDYSNNKMVFHADKDGIAARGSGSLTGVRPMITYGKNGLPLVWSSGQETYGYYNYRGPMMAFLPQNEKEGGEFVGTQSLMSCYLGLIDVDLTGASVDPGEPENPDNPNEPGGQDNPSKPGESSDPSVPSADSESMYRLYNPNSGEHFYTADVSERSYLIGLGWSDEGVGWTAPKTGDAVYRLYNANGGEHHYTLDVGERDALVAAGWSDEGVGWCSAPSDTGVPLYRQYNPNAFANNHNYTTSSEENSWLVGLGWNFEGIAWYGVS